VFIVLTWLLLALLGGAQLLLPALPAGVALPQLAPGLAALLMLAILRRDALRPCFSLGTRPIVRVTIAVAAPIIIALIAAALAGVTLTWSVSPGALAWIPVGALGEELGWRGYLHRVLDARMRGLLSSILVGLTWLPFHVGLWGLGMPRLALFGLTLVAASIVIFALVHDVTFSVTIAAVCHAAFNIGAALLGGASTNTPVMALMAAGWSAAAVAAVLLRRRAFLAVP
jgi:membrane protease YdiL (CAAX protease family)